MPEELDPSQLHIKRSIEARESKKQREVLDNPVEYYTQNIDEFVKLVLDELKKLKPKP